VYRSILLPLHGWNSRQRRSFHWHQSSGFSLREGVTAHVIRGRQGTSCFGDPSKRAPLCFISTNWPSCRLGWSKSTSGVGYQRRRFGHLKVKAQYSFPSNYLWNACEFWQCPRHRTTPRLTPRSVILYLPLTNSWRFRQLRTEPREGSRPGNHVLHRGCKISSSSFYRPISQ
jgi:hypothetical protein